MDKIADLHIHTLFSDGVLTPLEILQKAAEHGLSAISITDHDNIDGWIEAQSHKDKFSIEVIIGCELSCYENGKEIHMLAYMIDPDNDNLKKHLENFRSIRYERAKRILQKLQKLGLNINIDLVEEKAGKAPIIRPHIASSMVEKGYVRNIKEAFIEYIGNDRPAYEPKANFPVNKCIELINDSGGIAVLAHPANIVTQGELYKMIECGLGGIEVIHPMHNVQVEKYYRSIARQYWLVETGGSDYHGSRDYDEECFGKLVVPYTTVESIRLHAVSRQMKLDI